MKVIAKVTSHMEDDTDHVWIVKGKTYELHHMFMFTDEQGDTHFIEPCELHEFFKVVAD